MVLEGDVHQSRGQNKHLLAPNFVCLMGAIMRNAAPGSKSQDGKLKDEALTHAAPVPAGE